MTNQPKWQSADRKVYFLLPANNRALLERFARAGNARYTKPVKVDLRGGK
jgi:hypothetical protein